MNKIVLIEPYRPSSHFWNYLLKNIKMPELTVENVIEKYQGFEGELLYMSTVDELELQLKEDLKTLVQIDPSIRCLFINVVSELDSPISINESLLKCGYDVGVCDSEKTIYSSIFNEIIFGHFPELILYKNSLNENLLFPNKVLAEEYVKIHKQLSIQGKGIEDYEEMIIYEIRKENLS